MSRTRTTMALFVVVIAGLVLAGCSSDDEDSGGDSGGDGGGAAATEVDVEGSDDFKFSPSSATVVAGEAVTASFENSGAVDHNWTVLSEEISSEDEFDEGLVIGGVAENVAGGASATGSLNLDAGSYQVICTVPGHFAAGMEGTVTAE